MKQKHSKTNQEPAMGKLYLIDICNVCLRSPVPTYFAVGYWRLEGVGIGNTALALALALALVLRMHKGVH